MPVTNIRSRWDSGNLIFHEYNNLAVTGNVLTIAPGQVTIGNENNDVDLKIWMSATAYALFDYGNEIVTLSGIDVALSGDLAITVGQVSLADDLDVEFGTGTDALVRWSTADDNNHALVIALGDTNQGLHITDKGAVATDWNIAATTNPTLYIHSNTSPATDYLMLGDHDGTTAYIDVVGGTTLSIDIAGTPEVVIAAASTSPATTNSNALGTTALMWSDLFLADAGVINWNNGDTTLTATGNLLTLGASGLSVGADGAGFDVIFYGDRTGSDFFWDQNGQTNGSLNLGTTTVSEGVDFFAHGDTASNYLHWDCSADDLMIIGTAARVLHGGDAAGNDVIFYGAITNYAVTWDANGDTNGQWEFGADTYGVSVLFRSSNAGRIVTWDPNGDTDGSWAFGADTEGIMVNLYGDVTGCGVFWDPSTDTNGTLTIGGSGGSKGNDVVIYGDTNGVSLTWDQSADSLIYAGNPGAGNSPITIGSAGTPISHTTDGDINFEAYATFTGDTGYFRGLYSDVTYTPTSATGTASVYGIMGYCEMGTGKTHDEASSERLVGTDGRFVNAGTLDGAGIWVAGTRGAVYGSGTWTEVKYVSGVMACAQLNSTVTTGYYAAFIAYQSVSAKPADAALYAYGYYNLGIDLSGMRVADASAFKFATGFGVWAQAHATAGTEDGLLRVMVDGDYRFIHIYDTS